MVNTGLYLNTNRHIKIRVQGSNMKVWIDNTLYIDTDDATYTDGYFGLISYGVAARFDNLVVRRMPYDNEIFYIRDTEGNVIAEYDGGGKLLAEYVYANGQRIAKMNAGGDVDYYLNDHLGSARAMAGSKWSANYYPFGEIASQGGSQEDTRYDFTGKERDRGTGLHYFGARYYDPSTGGGRVAGTGDGRRETGKSIIQITKPKWGTKNAEKGSRSRLWPVVRCQWSEAERGIFKKFGVEGHRVYGLWAFRKFERAGCQIEFRPDPKASAGSNTYFFIEKFGGKIGPVWPDNCVQLWMDGKVLKI
ncbi:MAG: RHS repeat-associated core domain-containing protein [Calditrichia bacterium]